MNSTKYTQLRNNTQRQVISVEAIPNKLYWYCSLISVKKEDYSHIINTDLEFQYTPFFKDFGPLNLGLVHRYIQMLDKLLNEEKYSGTKVIHSTTLDLSKKTNAAFLMGCYMVIRLGILPEDAWQRFQAAGQFRPYRDPANNTCYEQKLLECWKGLKKAHSLGWYNPDTFDLKYYNHHSRTENGNFNVIVPSKFVAFNGPYFNRVDLRGYRRNIVEDYIDPFRMLGVTTIIRLNTKDYDERKFTSKGYRHLDFYFPDGTAPRKDLIQKFLTQMEGIVGGIAVHCHAGLGRTATMIGAYVIKHYKLNADEFIGWARICRPGSMHGPQQLLLKEIELDLLNEKVISGGNLYHIPPKNIYSPKNQNTIRSNSLKTTTTTQQQQQQQQQQQPSSENKKQQFSQTQYNSVQHTPQKSSPLAQYRNLSQMSTPQKSERGDQMQSSLMKTSTSTFLNKTVENTKLQNELLKQSPQKTIQKSLSGSSQFFNRTALQFTSSITNLPTILPTLKQENKSLLSSDKIKARNPLYKLTYSTPKSKENNFFENKSQQQIKSPSPIPIQQPQKQLSSPNSNA